MHLTDQLGKDVLQWFAHSPSMQWQHGRSWFYLSALVVGYAYVTARELASSPTGKFSIEHFEFLSSWENEIYDASKINDDKVIIRSCLALQSERDAFCDAYNLIDEELATFGTLLPFVFPKRLRRYQWDWFYGFRSDNVHAPMEYAAMRLAADLTGIETPECIDGMTAMELGVKEYASALMPISEFISRYNENNA